MPQIELCDECGRDWPRKELRRKLRASGYSAGANYLLYSSYNSSFWTCDTAADAGAISIGLYADRYRPRVQEGTTTEAAGSQTWTGTGTLRSTTSTDISGLTNLFFCAYVGPYHSQTVQTATIAMGLCSSDGSTKYLMKTYTNQLGERFCWYTSPVADLDPGVTTSAAYFYITVTITGTNKWWADGFCVADNTKIPSYRPQTTGASIVRSGPGYNWSIPVLCPQCGKRERLLKPSERYGNFRVADWVEIEDNVEDL